MEFWPHPLKQWNPVAILIIIAILNLSLHCNHWNSDPTPPNISIPALSLNTLDTLSYPLKQWNSGPIFVHIGILTSSFTTLQLWPYLHTHWNPNLILLEFWPYFVTYCNLDLILPNIELLALFFINNGILTLFFQTLEFWPLFINIGILIESIHTLELWPCFFADWNFQLILPSIWILALFLQTMEFLSYPFTANIKILALSCQTMEF